MGSVSEKEVQSVIRDVDVLEKPHGTCEFHKRVYVRNIIATHPLSVVVTEYSRYNE